MPEIFTKNDIENLNNQGVVLVDVEKQLERFKNGFPFLEITNYATEEKGISVFTSQELEQYAALWGEYSKSDHSIVKFVPASGAASRMFKDLFAFLENDSTLSNNDFIRRFFENLDKFAFFEDLSVACLKVKGETIESLIEKGLYKDIIGVLLLKDGLNYGALPKGLLKFHSYESESRTPIEEHLVEGSLYAKSLGSKVSVHFTVSPEHRVLIERLVDDVKDVYEKNLQTQFLVTFSEQKAKTNTIAVDEYNIPFRIDGDLFFRPGGHGALIENLNDLLADVIFIKNIDNVIPDNLKDQEAFYKKALGGYLVDVQNRIFKYLQLLESGVYSRTELLEILYFLQDVLSVKNLEVKFLEDAELVMYLRNKLDRPIRVCGMVKNVGEAGGGPFFAVNSDGTISLQILESSQIDLNDPVKKELFVNGSHFNPVDIVCGVKNFRGEKFDLLTFVDENTGFVSEKTKDGKFLKALELPGLWNGAMSDWTTLFVEVPLITFNPVKSVNDLLRKEHQAFSLK